MESRGTSEYELDRLERIKENQKMLEELFPDGPPDLIVPKSRKRRVQADVNSLGTGSRSGSEASDEEGSYGPSKPKRVYQKRYYLLVPGA